MPITPLFGGIAAKYLGVQASLAAANGSTLGYAVPDSAVNVLVAFQASSTAGGVLQFEVSFDATSATTGVWFPVTGYMQNGGGAGITSSTSAFTANVQNQWQVPVAGASWFRVRVSTALGAQLAQLNMVFTTTDNGFGFGGTYTVAGTTTVSGTVTANTATPSNYALTSTASTNAASVKNGAATLFGGIITNPAASTVYVKIYNKASAPTVGTDSPVLTIPVAAGATVSLTPGALGIRFGTGLAIAVTGAGTDADTSNAVAGVKIDLAYV